MRQQTLDGKDRAEEKVHGTDKARQLSCRRLVNALRHSPARIRHEVWRQRPLLTALPPAPERLAYDLDFAPCRRKL